MMPNIRKAILATMLFMSPLIATGQNPALNNHSDGIDTKLREYRLHWVCLGDTLGCDTTDNGSIRYLVDGIWATCQEMTQDVWNFYMTCNPSPVKNDSLPLTGATPEQVDSFLVIFSKMTGREWRLPTREEWLFIYHGGLFSEGYKFCGSNRPEWVAWYKGNSHGKLQPIEQRIPNEVFMYDMLGNAAEMATDGDRIVMMGGCYLDPYPADNPEHLTTNPPLKACGFRPVCHKAQWFYKE